MCHSGRSEESLIRSRGRSFAVAQDDRHFGDGRMQGNFVDRVLMVISIRLGESADVDAAVSLYERSNLAYRQGIWPNRAAGVERVSAHLRDPATWFLLGRQGPALIGMASAKPLRDQDGAGSAIP